MSNTELGRLKNVDLRSHWLNEAADFTPWLASEENISLLGEAIGLDLEVQDQESRVGPFRADILCRDTLTDKYVLIENQLEQTDHTHLGQLLTYAAGLDAVTMIWIAKHFTEEHRASMDWLNNITDDSVNFFGIQIELWKIGDSPPAPKFNLVAKPNDWTKTVKKSASAAKSSELTEIKKLQMDYWAALKAFLEREHSFLNSQKPAPAHWTNFAIGRSYFHLVAIANTRDSFIAAYLVITGPDGKVHFRMLREQCEEDAQSIFGDSLDWREMPSAKESQVYIRIDLDPTVRSNWDEQHRWLMEKLEELHKYFSPRIKKLDANEYMAVEGVTE